MANSRPTRPTSRSRSAALRARNAIVQRTLDDLRASIQHGHPITLPNLLRLCRRRLVAHDPDAPDNQISRALHDLSRQYRRMQPFR